MSPCITCGNAVHLKNLHHVHIGMLKRVPNVSKSKKS
jgi:hypothetical protein